MVEILDLGLLEGVPKMDFTDDNVHADGSDAYTVETWTHENTNAIQSLWEWGNPEVTPLRIAVVGVAGGGKKDLASSLSYKLSIPYIGGVSRTANLLGARLNKRADMVDEFMIILAQLHEQYEYAEYVSASTLIDILAHMTYITNNSDDDRLRYILTAASNLIGVMAVNQYTVLFYVPFREKPPVDGTRTTDVRYLKELDRLTLHYLRAFDLDFLPIDGDDNNKLSIALRYMGDFGLLGARDLS